MSARTRSALWCGLLASLALFAAGTVVRPDGDGWAQVHDLVLYNAIALLSAALCWRGRRHADVWAARACAVALVLNAAGNVLYTLHVARLDPEPFPSVADAAYLAYYPALYVALLLAVRTRAGRLLPSMWLDGLVAGLGAAAVAVAFLLGPSLAVVEGDRAAVLVNLAYPLADLLLLALLVGTAGVLGLRADRALVLLAVGTLLNLAADIAYLDLVAHDAYVEGTPLDLLWLLGMVALASGFGRRRLPTPLPPAPRRTGLRVLALPVVCNAAALLLLVLGAGDRFPPLVAWCAGACTLAATVRLVLTVRDVRDLDEVRRLAGTDALTGLPNRRALQEAAERVLRVGPAALLLFDLDGFKEVNDGLGHPTGDALLRLLAERLRGALPATDVVARLGGDEFSVLVGPDDVQRAHAVLREALARPFTVDGVRLRVGASCGAASAPAGGSFPELLRRADIAMYQAKRGDGSLQTWSAELADGLADRVRAVEELRAALDRDELLVHLQPQLHAGSGEPVGVEALVRWRHPARGLLSPAELLPAVEQAGLTVALTDRVLDLALAAAASWWPQLAVPVSVNITATDVLDEGLPERATAALRRHGLPPRALVLEVVEDSLISDHGRASAVLGRLRRQGVQVSLDDYGTGWSSLSYLRHLPADELKLDRAFTRDLLTDARAAAIVEHTVALAHALGLRLVAEGVEDDATAAALSGAGCDVLQGYGLCRPLPAAAARAWLLERALVPSPRGA